MRDLTIVTWCVVPWCTEQALRRRLVLPRELRGLCRRCDDVVRSQARWLGLAEARRRRDARLAPASVGLGACDLCGQPAVRMDLDGGARCSRCAEAA